MFFFKTSSREQSPDCLVLPLPPGGLPVSTEAKLTLADGQSPPAERLTAEDIDPVNSGYLVCYPCMFFGMCIVFYLSTSRELEINEVYKVPAFIASFCVRLASV